MADSIIITEKQYEDALSKVFHLMQRHPAIDTTEGKKLDFLIMLIEQYEEIHYPMRIKR